VGHLVTTAAVGAADAVTIRIVDDENELGGIKAKVHGGLLGACIDIIPRTNGGNLVTGAGVGQGPMCLLGVFVRCDVHLDARRIKGAG